jgi:hypothetical protein
VNPEAPNDFEQMQRVGSHAGFTVLRHSDGSNVRMHFRASETTVGGMPLYIGICWPVD